MMTDKTIVVILVAIFLSVGCVESLERRAQMPQSSSAASSLDAVGPSTGPSGFERSQFEGVVGVEPTVPSDLGSQLEPYGPPSTSQFEVVEPVHIGTSLGSSASKKSPVPFIVINWISDAGVTAGNSQRVGVGFKVVFQTGTPVYKSGTSSFELTPVCGLSNSDFKLETLSLPPGAPEIMSAVAPSSSCDYILNVAPVKDSHGNQNTWAPGPYSVMLHYYKGGNELASKSINFTIGDTTKTASMQNLPATMSEGPQGISNADQRLWLNPQPEPPLEPDGTLAKLTELKKLFDGGLITQEDYDKKKAEILASM